MAFVKWSKIGYFEIEKKPRREYWDNAEVTNIINPCAIFLKNCSEPLEGVCKYNEKRLNVSGVFGQSISIAELVTIWIGQFVKVSPKLNKKEEVFVWNFKKLL